MQLRMIRRATNLLIVVAALIMAMTIGYYYFQYSLGDYRTLYLVGFLFISGILLGGLKLYEDNWDRGLTLGMLRSGRVALASITGVRRHMEVRDSSFMRYWLWKFDARLTAPGVDREVNFYARLADGAAAPTSGVLRVTFDPERPDCVFMVSDLLAAKIPEAAEAYKSCAAILADCRPLSVRKAKGLHIEEPA